MPNTHFSDRGLQSIQPPLKGQQDFWDTSLPSFGCRVSQGGSKTFILKRDNRRITIGRFPIISLSQARIEAKRLLAEFTLGRIRPQSLTYAQAIDLFIEDKQRTLRSSTVAEYKRLLNRLPFKGQLNSISHEEVTRILKRFDSPSEQTHLIVALKVFFNWCMKKRFVTENPLFGLSHKKSPTRARVLSNAELKSIWKACNIGASSKGRTAGLGPADDGSSPSAPDKIPAAFAVIVKLLMLTGQRRGEIAALQTSWLQKNQITLPPEATKNGREHCFPVGKSVRALCNSSVGSSHLLFPARGTKHTPFNGWSKSKVALDKLSGVTDWTLHDLRRTFSTRLAEAGTPPHIIERLLNHVSGTISGVAAVYNRHHFMPEMRKAVEKYNADLSRLFKR